MQSHCYCVAMSPITSYADKVDRVTSATDPAASTSPTSVILILIYSYPVMKKYQRILARPTILWPPSRPQWLRLLSRRIRMP